MIRVEVMLGLTKKNIKFIEQTTNDSMNDIMKVFVPKKTN